MGVSVLKKLFACPQIDSTFLFYIKLARGRNRFSPIRSYSPFFRKACLFLDRFMLSLNILKSFQWKLEILFIQWNNNIRVVSRFITTFSSLIVNPLWELPAHLSRFEIEDRLRPLYICIRIKFIQHTGIYVVLLLIIEAGGWIARLDSPLSL